MNIIKSLIIEGLKSDEVKILDLEMDLEKILENSNFQLVNEIKRILENENTTDSECITKIKILFWKYGIGIAGWEDIK